MCLYNLMTFRMPICLGKNVLIPLSSFISFPFLTHIICILYTSVAKVLRDVDAIVVAQYDLTENDVDPKYFDEPTLPVFRLYLKGSKDKPITYKGNNLFPFLVFINIYPVAKYRLCLFEGPLTGPYMLSFLNENFPGAFNLEEKVKEFHQAFTEFLEEEKRLVRFLIVFHCILCINFIIFLERKAKAGNIRRLTRRSDIHESADDVTRTASVD